MTNSLTAIEFSNLVAAGITNAINVEGGTTACVAAGVQVVRGKKAISLER